MSLETIIDHMRKIAFIIWFLLLAIPLGISAYRHTAVLNPISDDSSLSLKISTKKDFQIIHILAPFCACSKNIYDFLISKEIENDSLEQVILIEEEKNWENALKNKGYLVRVITDENFSENNKINTIPQLLIFSRRNEHANYIGGYSNKKVSNTSILFNEVLNQIRNEQQVKSLPIYGCIKSQNKLLNAIL